MNFDQTYCSGSRCPKRELCVHFIGHVSEWAMENNKGYIEGPLDVVERSLPEGGACREFDYVPGEDPIENGMNAMVDRFLRAEIKELTKPSIFDKLPPFTREPVYGPGNDTVRVVSIPLFVGDKPLDEVIRKYDQRMIIREIDDFMDDICKWRPTL